MVQHRWLRNRYYSIPIKTCCQGNLLEKVVIALPGIAFILWNWCWILIQIGGKCSVRKDWQMNSLNSLRPSEHICVGKLTIIGSDNGLSPERRQAIIWTNAGILLIGPLGTNFSEILIEIQTFSLKMSSAKCCSFCLGLNVLIQVSTRSVL